MQLDALFIPGLQYTPGSFQSGAGSPEGVVAAPVGTVYEDTSATNGAVLWVKASGAGNTGWQVVTGDTGTRVLLSWDNTGVMTKGAFASADWGPASGSAGDFRIRRVNNVVQVSASNLAALVGTPSGPMVTLPLGFRSALTTAVTAYNANTLYMMSVVGSNLGRGPTVSVPINTSFPLLNATYLTTDPWPTVLP